MRGLQSMPDFPNYHRIFVQNQMKLTWHIVQIQEVSLKNIQPKSEPVMRTPMQRASKMATTLP